MIKKRLDRLSTGFLCCAVDPGLEFKSHLPSKASGYVMLGDLIILVLALLK